MAKLQKLRIDTAKAVDGVLFDFREGIRFRIARFNNPHYKKVVAELTKPVAAAVRAGDQTVAEKINREAAARALLLGWENIEDDDGKPLAYSPEKALEILGDPAMQDVYDFVVMCAMNLEAFRLEAVGN